VAVRIVVESAPTTVAQAPATTLPLAQQVTSQEIQSAVASRESNVQDLSIPIYVDSQLPKAVPEDPLVIQTSNDRQLDVITINEQLIQLQDSTGFRLSVSATDGKGNLTQVNTRGAIVVEHRNFITVTGEGFLPNSDAVAWLFSEPRRLGVVRVRADGSFEESLQISEDVPVGDHTTQVNGLTPSGDVRSLNLAVEVRERAPVVTDTTIDPVIVANSGERTSTSIGVALLVLGVILGSALTWFFVLLRRRRREEPSAS
jgi:hypothetical protein